MVADGATGDRQLLYRYRRWRLSCGGLFLDDRREHVAALQENARHRFTAVQDDR